MNMNGKEEDKSYRYTMSTFSVQIAGKGNGIHTIFNNMRDISETINVPAEIIFKYIAAVTGSNYIPAKNTITGAHTTEDLNKIILVYIKYLVMCPVCNIPETVPEVEGSKKNTKLKLCCSACKNVSYVTNANKQIDKGIDIIIKYLNSGSLWKTNKGTMVQISNETEFNPFE